MSRPRIGPQGVRIHISFNKPLRVIMKACTLFFVAILAVSMAEQLRPVSKVLKAPEYSFDRKTVHLPCNK